MIQRLLKCDMPAQACDKQGASTIRMHGPICNVCRRACAGSAGTSHRHAIVSYPHSLLGSYQEPGATRRHGRARPATLRLQRSGRGVAIGRCKTRPIMGKGIVVSRHLASERAYPKWPGHSIDVPLHVRHLISRSTVPCSASAQSNDHTVQLVVSAWLCRTLGLQTQPPSAAKGWVRLTTHGCDNGRGVLHNV